MHINNYYCLVFTYISTMKEFPDEDESIWFIINLQQQQSVTTFVSLVYYYFLITMQVIGGFWRKYVAY